MQSKQNSPRYVPCRVESWAWQEILNHPLVAEKKLSGQEMLNRLVTAGAKAEGMYTPKESK